MHKWKKWIKELVALAIVTVIGLTIVGYLRAPSFASGQTPPLDAKTIDNETVSLEKMRGKPVMLHFWATWCPTCRVEAGNISDVAKTYSVVTIAVKSGKDNEIEQYMSDNTLDFPVINDMDGAIAQAFNISVFPTTILIGSDGNVSWSETGYTTTWGLKLRMWFIGG